MVSQFLAKKYPKDMELPFNFQFHGLIQMITNRFSHKFISPIIW